MAKGRRRPKLLQWKWWKRQLFLFHRWLGILLCLLFSAWFVSGIFMMYVEYPQLDHGERLVGGARLDFSSAHITAAQAVEKLRVGDFQCKGALRKNRCSVVADPEAAISPSKVRMAMLLGRPVYYVDIVAGGQPRGVLADTGDVLERLGPDLAKAVAEEFYQRLFSKPTASVARFLGMVQRDQWTLSSSLNGHRPLLHFAFDDERRTEFYVSSSTGEVVRDSNRLERGLNYFAAVTHWLYPTVLRQFPNAWAWVVDVLSGVGVVLAITGLWIGWLRWKRNPKPGKPAIPYRGVMRWHYITGVLFGVVTVTWVFSGLLSMNPGKLNPSRSPTPDQKQLFLGVSAPILSAAFPMTSPDFPNTVVAAELSHFNGRALYRLWHRDGRREQRDAASWLEMQPDTSTLTALAQKLLPQQKPTEIEVLDRYDNYYFSRHPERGGKPLPMLRIKYADASRTWFHIDVVRGELLERSTQVNRLYRWLYNGLHSWDILWLWERRPLWDITVISFSLGGLSLSLLGVVVGWRRLRYCL